MKKGLYIILAFTGIMNLYSCKDEVEIQVIQSLIFKHHLLMPYLVTASHLQ